MRCVRYRDVLKMIISRSKIIMLLHSPPPLSINNHFKGTPLFCFLFVFVFLSTEIHYTFL